MTPMSVPANQAIADAGHLNDLKLAASKMLGAERRAFQAAMALKYCAGSPRQAEAVFGWSRCAVELGLHEKRTGIVCLSARSAFCGDARTMLEWAKSMTWKGIHPSVELSRKVYEKGICLSKKAMKAVEARLQRHPELPKWDILIRPACMV